MPKDEIEQALERVEFCVKNNHPGWIIAVRLLAARLPALGDEDVEAAWLQYMKQHPAGRLESLPKIFRAGWDAHASASQSDTKTPE